MGQRTGGEYTSPEAGCVLGQTMGVKVSITQIINPKP